MFDDQGQFVGLEKAFQQQYRRANTPGPQREGLLDTGHGKTIGLGFQGLGTEQRTMTVGIGLDHREGSGTRYFTGQLIVVTQGLEVDQGTGRTHGGKLLDGQRGIKNRCEKQ